MKSVEIPLDLLIVASERYWTDKAELRAVAQNLDEVFSGATQATPSLRIKTHLITSAEEIPTKTNAQTALIIPLSGGVQRMLHALGSRYRRVGLFNAYLPQAGLPEPLAYRLLERNAHPACTDFWALQHRMGSEIYWLGGQEDLRTFFRAVEAVGRLRSSRLLLVGETENWVLNSCRDLEFIQTCLGVEVIPIPLEDFAQVCSSCDSTQIDASYQRVRPFLQLAEGLSDSDIKEACAPLTGLSKLLEEHGAAGFALGCFEMIPRLKTTGCLSMAYINGITPFIGACEGDLDAALTMLLVKNLGAKHFWMGNPIIFNDNSIQLVHCTASWHWGETDLSVTIKRHHESGVGAAPSVSLPEGEPVVLTRIGNELRDLLLIPGRTLPTSLLPTCRTQQRIQVASSSMLRDSLLGTHIISAAGGEIESALPLAARMLGLRIIGSS